MRRPLPYSKSRTEWSEKSGRNSSPPPATGAMMIDLPAQRCFRLCDGLSRRDFLRIGALGVGGLTLADLLRLRARGHLTTDQPPKSVIMVLLRGGPSHIDTFDPKPKAPADIRGPFKPIATNVSGIQVSEI